MKKGSYSPTLEVQGETYAVPRFGVCDRDGKRAPFYGFDNIGPRHYAVYRCETKGHNKKIRARINIETNKGVPVDDPLDTVRPKKKKETPSPTPPKKV
jgi:hypothetical protein